MSADAGIEAEDERPSRSQRKREHLAWQALGAELAGLPDAQLRQMGLEAELEREIRAARSMKASGARNRLLKHIAQRLSESCEQTALRTALHAMQTPRRAQTAREHRASALREQVLRSGASGLGLALRDADIDRLEALRTIALHPGDDPRARHARREIYRLILGLIDG